jgi:hypothetical protein
MPDDLRDTRNGTYDPVNSYGNPQPHQVNQPQSAHERAQPGAPVQSEPPLPSNEPPLPEGLRRTPKGPYSQRRPGSAAEGARERKT